MKDIIMGGREIENKRTPKVVLTGCGSQNKNEDVLLIVNRPCRWVNVCLSFKEVGTKLEELKKPGAQRERRITAVGCGTAHPSIRGMRSSQTLPWCPLSARPAPGRL